MTPEALHLTVSEALIELTILGIDLRRQDQYPDCAIESVEYLHEQHPEMIEQVIASIRCADADTRMIWKQYFARMFAVSYRNIKKDYERLIANSRITARLLDSIDYGIIGRRGRFQTTTIAISVEYTTGINPGDDDYIEVQAAIIYCAIAHPHIVASERPGYSDEWYRLADSRSLKLIMENMSGVLTVLPALCQRGDIRPDAIEALLTVTPSLAVGVL